jgi:hypothetical protein
MSEPYVRVVPDGNQVHLVFVARVVHWPFDELRKHVWEPWGSDVQAQLLERQLRFVGALHPGYLPRPQRAAEAFTIDLRYIYRPGAARVECVLLGKVVADNEQQGRPRVLALWEKLLALVPLGYSLQSAAAEAEFVDWSGEDLARQDDNPGLAWAEIRRPVESLPRSALPVLYPFGWQPSGWEPVWLAQVRLDRPSLVSVSLRPVSLEPFDERLLADLVYSFGQAATDAPWPLSAQVAEVAGLYASYLSVARALFSVRVLVKGPTALQNAVCVALSNFQDQDRLNNLVPISDSAAAAEPSAGGPGSAIRVSSMWNAKVEVSGDVAGRDIAHHQHNYTLEARRFGLRLEVVKPTPTETPALRANFERLEQAQWRADPRFNPFVDGGLRYMVDAAGALCAFRLPMLPADGLPGVRVGAEMPPPKSDEVAGASESTQEAAPAKPALQADEAAAQVGEAVRNLVEGLLKSKSQSDSASTESTGSAPLAASSAENA